MLFIGSARRQLEGNFAALGLDDHDIPRWTRLFSISKGYHTTRNKHMKVERVYYFYDLDRQELAHLVSKAGKDETSGILGGLAPNGKSSK